MNVDFALLTITMFILMWTSHANIENIFTKEKLKETNLRR